MAEDGLRQGAGDTDVRDTEDITCFWPDEAETALDSGSPRADLKLLAGGERTAERGAPFGASHRTPPIAEIPNRASGHARGAGRPEGRPGSVALNVSTG